MQGELSAQIRNRTHSSVGEEEIVDKVKQHLLKRGLDQSAANEAASKLKDKNEAPSQNEQRNAAADDGGSENEERTIPNKGHVISYSKKRKLRHLHWIGKCHRRPSYEYKVRAFLGDTLPSAEHCDAKFLQCWKPKPVVSKSSSSSSTSGTTTSSSTDSK